MCSGVVPWKHERQTARCCQTTRRHVHRAGPAGILLRGVLREYLLDRIFEGVTEDIREITSAEGRCIWLAVNVKEAIPEGRVQDHS